MKADKLLRFTGSMVRDPSFMPVIITFANTENGIHR